MKEVWRKRFLLFFVFMSVYQLSYTKEKNPTEWPYGGKPDISRFDSKKMREIPLKFIEANFYNTTFSQYADFDKANFTQEAVFLLAKFSKAAYFRWATFSQAANFSTVKFSEDANFSVAKFSKYANFSTVKFSKDAKFIRATFSQAANFSVATFSQDVYFNEATFSQDASLLDATFLKNAYFSDAIFKNNANFIAAKFLKSAYFSATKFSKNAYFSGASFSKNTYFRRAKFSQDAYFRGATFSQKAYFIDARFSKNANFNRATFKEIPIFEGCKLGKFLYLNDVNFEKGADFRRAIFDSIKNIYIDHNTRFPAGKFFLYWKQFKGKGKPRISLYNPPVIHTSEDSITIKKYISKIAEIDSLLEQKDEIRVGRDILNMQRDSLRTLLKYEKDRLDRIYDAKYESVRNEHFQKIETFYHRLRDNFINQGDKSSADAVMYELGRQRQEIKKECWWKLYGWFFAWGYKPWRFLVFAVVPIIIIFGLFWYFHFYNIVALIVADKMSNDLKEILQKQTNLKGTKIFKRWEIKHFDHKQIKEKISTPARIWHIIFFSATVLLGIRFKKEWIEKKNLKFLYLVTFEWLLGIGLFILFAILVKSNQFAYIKGLLGF